MQELPADELENYLELYNIGYVLVFTNYGRAYFDNIECMEKMYSGGTFTIYQNTTNEQNFCYQSKARVRADYDSIIVQTAENETTILKYHYYESLKIEPSALVLEPVYLYDDPVPFISVKNGDIKNFVIYN